MGRDAAIERGFEDVFVDRDVAAESIAEARDLAEDRPVVSDERVSTVPLAEYERVADEELRGPVRDRCVAG